MGGLQAGTARAMTYRLVIKRRAQEDILEAWSWYQKESIVIDLAGRFHLALEDAFDRIKRSPGTPRLRERGLRMMLLRKFPYCVYYKLLENAIEVHGVLHGHQDRESILEDRQ
jgi:toxin ParE1/3/4